MQVLKDTLGHKTEAWDIPGSHYLPPLNRDYIVGLEGKLLLKLDSNEQEEIAECPEDFLDDIVADYLPQRIPIETWDYVLEGNILTINGEGCELVEHLPL